VPNASDTKAQQVLLQLTRLPTTVDQTSWTGADELKPVAVMATGCSLCLSERKRGLHLAAGCETAATQRRAGVEVGATLTGQSIEDRGGPLSPVTVKVTVAPFV